MAEPHPLDRLAAPLRTDRLVLRRSESRDLDAQWEYRGRPEVGEWLGWHPVDRADWDAMAPGRAADTLVFELAEAVGAIPAGTVIGDVMIKVGASWSQREVADAAAGTQAELGWTMHPDFEGRGYATEAVREAIRFCFEDLGLHRVQAGAFTANEASTKLMRRVGMRLESSTVRDALHRDRGWVDGVMYGLLAADWRAARDGRAPRATILHGFTADPAKHWFPWLAERLEANGFDARVPELPDPAAPDPDAWAAATSEAIGDVRDGDVVVAHSLGCVAVLRALADLDARRAGEAGGAEPAPGREGSAPDGSGRQSRLVLGCLVLVAGFGERLESLPEIDGFTESAMSGVELGGIPGLVRRIVVIRSDDDPIVPASASDALAEALGVEAQVVPGAGHFLDREGVTRLPEALRAAVVGC